MAQIGDPLEDLGHENRFFSVRLVSGQSMIRDALIAQGGGYASVFRLLGATRSNPYIHRDHDSVCTRSAAVPSSYKAQKTVSTKPVSISDQLLLRFVGVGDISSISLIPQQRSPRGDGNFLDSASRTYTDM